MIGLILDTIDEFLRPNLKSFNLCNKNTCNRVPDRVSLKLCAPSGKSPSNYVNKYLENQTLCFMIG